MHKAYGIKETLAVIANELATAFNPNISKQIVDEYTRFDQELIERKLYNQKLDNNVWGDAFSD